jgi:hypothetical protein
MRAPIVLFICIALAACSDSEDLPPMKPYVPPPLPTAEAQSKVVKQAVKEAKLTGSIEVSDLQPNDRGPGHFMLCIRGVSNDSRTLVYAAFLDEKDYKGLRLPVILDDCGKQSYHPFVPVEEPENKATARRGVPL